MRQERLSDEQYARLDRIGHWAYDTCIIFGATPATAWKVAGAFVAGVERAWLEPERSKA